MKKLRIAFVYDNISSYICGANLSTLRFAKLLKEQGHHIIFISSKFKGSKSVDYFDGIKTYRFFSIIVPKTGGHFFMSFPRVSKLIEIFKKEKIQIVHYMTPVISATQAVKAANYLGLKLVAHHHTQPENIFFHFPKIFINKFVFDWFYKDMIEKYKQAEVIICPSKFAERSLKRYDKSLNTRVISNGVDRTKFKKVKFLDFLKKHGLKKENKRLLFIGRLYPEKNVEVLIKAMPNILMENKATDLLIVGSGELKEKLEFTAKTLGINKQIHFLGRIPDEDLVKAYNSCDIFILPSIAELEGMVVLEAMACGKPIIISDSEETAAKDFVQKNGFIFKTTDKLDLAKKVNIILSNPKLEKNMAKMSLKEIKNYDIRDSILKLEKVYHSLIK